MKVLVHRIPGNGGPAFELADLKAHLRVDDTAEDAVIQTIGETAAAEIEHFAQIALNTQIIRVNIFDPVPHEYSLNLPIGPVADGDVPTVTIDGAPFTAFDFVGGNRPYIRWLAEYYNLQPNRVTIEYQAGFGATAEDIPSDLSQALMDQAALHYDLRSPVHKQKWLTNSPHMARVGARYRGVQV